MNPGVTDMDQLIIKELAISNYEKVIEIKEPSVGLHAFIALHNTQLGPALGGIRAFPYKTREEAITDVLRLSRGMTYKSAMAETGTGGGKSVIILDPNNKTEELLLAFAMAIETLQGQYIGAEDVGINLADLAIMRQKTSYIVGLPDLKSSGDPSRFTAFGAFCGIKAVCKTLWGNDSIAGKVIAVQGLGEVGSKLTHQLFWEGAKLIISDINSARTKEIARQCGATIVPHDEVLAVECDILVPCAMGGIINSHTIPKLKCKAIAGVANNQLLEEKDGVELMKHNILYAPDFVINAGGLINVACEITEAGYDATSAKDRTSHIYNELLQIFKVATQKNVPTAEVANQLAEYKLEQLIGKRKTQVKFHH